MALPADRASEPVVARNPAVLYGLGNILENAVDFAHERVEVAASWTAEDVVVTISDDGAGFAPEIIGRIGEPYVRGRRGRKNSEVSGLGLGVFIAKTLLERTGAALTFRNRAFPGRGAIVRIYWTRSDFERRAPPPLEQVETVA
jgi:two-component system sensor histidine kinase RegB